MDAEEIKKRMPITEGLYRMPTNEEPGCLIASKCGSCGTHFHPKRIVCANCYSEDQEEVTLSNRGKIYTYTISRVGPPDAQVPAPFITGQIEMPENVQVLSLITDIDFDKVTIGTEVELYFWKTGEDEQGNEVMAYAFRPI
ncbi:Zn-ribbon domain-containing OB-fold protein [Thermodesulfobacteriota bacterium]